MSKCENKVLIEPRRYFSKRNDKNIILVGFKMPMSQNWYQWFFSVYRRLRAGIGDRMALKRKWHFEKHHGEQHPGRNKPHDRRVLHWRDPWITFGPFNPENSDTYYYHVYHHSILRYWMGLHMHGWTKSKLPNPYKVLIWKLMLFQTCRVNKQNFQTLSSKVFHREIIHEQ